MLAKLPPPATHDGPNKAPRPLVVDLDGTLIRSDLLIESLLRLLAVEPLVALRAPFWLRHGKAAFKVRVTDRTVLDLHMLPLNEDLVELIVAARAEGRPVYLASASDRRHVQTLADHLGLFDGVFASDGTRNLRGAVKADALCEAFGEGGFDYAGDAWVDLTVWERAGGAILVGASPRLTRAARLRCRIVDELPAPRRRWAAALRAMRPHQWLKNLLVFLPILAGHAFGAASLGGTVLAFLAFSLAASSAYLLNDLLDLPGDRDHPTKRLRPFASGALPLVYGFALVPALLLGAAVLALFLPPAFLAVLAAYYATTLAYSLVLKRKMIVDVMVLGGLYTLRVIAGAAAVAIPVSTWLLAFSMFLFLCLALMKRITELIARRRTGKGSPPGRGYRLDDLPMISALAGAAGYVAVLVLALYINSPDVAVLYPRPGALWAVCLLLLYWVSRALMVAHRGTMSDDPVVFAVKDRVSLLTGGLVVLFVLLGTIP